MKFRRAIFLLGLILMTGCGGMPLEATPFPTPEIWKVELDPALDWMRPDISTCTQSTEGVAVVIENYPLASSNSFTNEFKIAWGQADQIEGYAYILGQDELAIIVNQQNPLQDLSLADLKSVFEGKIGQWDEISSSSGHFSGDIHTWVYAQGNSIQNIFNNISGVENYQNPFAFLAPDPKAMLDAVREDPQAIGILPMKWVEPGVKQILIADLNEETLKQPIIVITQTQPPEKEKNWLICLMGKIEEIP